MNPLNRGGQPPAVEGAYASYNPRFQIPQSLQAEPNGLALGRFGWADQDTGLCYSVRPATGHLLLGFVQTVPILGVWADWRYKFWDRVRCCFVLRGGMEATLNRRGDFWARFPGGSYVTQTVYANVLDGTALAVDRGSDPGVGFELTPWSVVSECGSGGLAIISTWSTFA